MQHKIIKGSKAIEDINDLIKDEENRTTKIALFTMEEVNLYINTAKSMQTDLERIINNGLVRVDLATADHTWNSMRNIDYMGYKFCIKTTKPISITITPHPPFDELRNLLLELQQQKNHLIKLEKARDRLFQKELTHKFSKAVFPLGLKRSEKTPASLDEMNTEEEKLKPMDADFVNESMRDAEDKTALHVLQLYDGLVEQHKELTEKFRTLQIQETQKTELLETSLSQNENLQKQISLLNSQFAALREERLKISEAAAITQTQVEEQKSELSRLKHQEPLTSDIKRDYLVELLNKFDYKSGYGLFSSSIRDQTLDNLKKLSELKQEMVSIKEISNCIKDPIILKIFNDPYHYHDTRLLTKTGLIIRELAFIFREPQLLPKVSNQ
ncbi:MAG: hypothetical protein ACYCQI_07470 [Gammaproteobacteria bacterium]